MDNEINSFTLYREYINLINILSKKKRANFIEKIIDYVFFDVEPSFKTKEEVAIWQNLSRPINKAKNKSKNAKKQESESNQNEIKTESNQNQNDNTSDVVVNVNNKELNIFTYYENKIGQLSSTGYQELNSWLEIFTPDVIKFAIDEAIDYGVRTWKYINGILTNLKNQNLITMQQILEAKGKHQKSKGKKETKTPEWFNQKIEGVEYDDETIRLAEKIRNAK